MANKADGTGEASDNSFSLGEDDDGLDLSLGEDLPSDPADLNVDDMADGTEPVITDLSSTVPAVPAAPAGAQPQTVQGVQPAAPAPSAAPGSQPTSQQPAVDPNAAPAAPPAQQPAGGEQPGATVPQTVNIEEFVTANADAIIGNLASSHFKIDDKEAETLGFSPEVREWVQKRDAKNYLLTMVQMNNALQKTLPVVVAQLMTVATEAQKTQEGFYGEFPDLKDTKYTPHLRRLSVSLREMHPQMPQKEFQTLLGNSFRVAFGLPAQTQTQQPAQGNAQRVVRRGPPRSFTPAGALQPQRNHGGNGDAPQLTGLEFLNHSLKHDDG